MTDQNPPAEDPQTAALQALRESIDGLRADVREERRGRRTTQVLGALVVAAVLIVASVVGVNYVQAGRTTCSDKKERAAAADQRALIVLDAAAEFSDLTETQRESVRRFVTNKLEELPPPC